MVGAPPAVWRRSLPQWLVRTVLREWSVARAERSPATGPARRGPAASARDFWPNGLEATVGLGAPLNALPRLPLQVAACVRRAARGRLHGESAPAWPRPAAVR